MSGLLHSKQSLIKHGSDLPSSMKFPPQTHHGWTFSSMLSKINLQPLKSTPKAYFQPQESTSKGLNRASWKKVEVYIELQ